MRPREPIGPDAERAMLNDRGIEHTKDAAEILRNGVIGLSFDAVKTFLEGDIEQAKKLEENGYPDGEEIEIYVLSDFLSAPSKDGEFTMALSLLWQRDEAMTLSFVEVASDSPHSNDSRLRVYIPVPDDYQIGEDDIPRPDEVYVERIIDDNDSSRYVIRRDGMYEYESIKDTGEEVIYDDFSDRVLWRRMTRRVDTGLPILSVIAEDLINMTVIPQRVITVGEPEVRDL